MQALKDAASWEGLGDWRHGLDYSFCVLAWFFFLTLQLTIEVFFILLSASAMMGHEAPRPYELRPPNSKPSKASISVSWFPLVAASKHTCCEISSTQPTLWQHDPVNLQVLISETE